VDFWDLTRLIVRRWYFALPVLLVTLTGVLFASRAVRPDYSATGHLQLIPPAHPTETEPGKPKGIQNPWLQLGIQALGQAAILKVQDERTVKQLAAAGYSENFLISIDYPTTFFSVEATGHSPDQARSTVKQVMKLLTEDVRAEQAQFGVVDRDLIGTLTLDEGDKVTVVTSKVKRVLIVAVGLSLLLTAGFTIGLDAILRRRARRRGSPQPPQQAAKRDEPRDDGDEIDATAVIPAQRVNGRASEPARTGSGKPLPATKGSARVASSKVGRLIRSKSAIPPELDSSALVLDAPHAGERAEPAKTGRGPIVVEYHPTDEADEAAASGARMADGDRDEESELPIPSDATIVLPLSPNDWVPDAKGKRR